MNINHDDLSRLYKAYLKTRPPDTEEPCPGPREIWLFFDPKTGKRKKSKILRHIGSCASCAVDFQVIREISVETVHFQKEIENLAFSEKTKPPLESRHPKRLKMLFPRFRWGIIGPVSALIIVSGVMIYRSYHTAPSSSESMREHIQPEIFTISPPNQSAIKRDALRFSWKKDPLSEAYTVELFDESLSRIWKSRPVSVNELSAPVEIRNTLDISAKYLWMVTGYRKSGQNIESALSTFRIIQ